MLSALALVVRLGTAALISRPGYMDSAYYAAGAVRLAQGGGFTEPFIWNYLNDPVGLPHPGFLYWMPLPSMLGAPFALLFPGSFFALQMPFAILSALVSVVAYGLALEATGQRRLAWAAGLLTIFSGFFFPYWTLPATFAPFALFGSLALWLAGGWRREDGEGKGEMARWGLVGVLVGLAHLTRADGVLLLGVTALGSVAERLVRRAGESRQDTGETSAPWTGRLWRGLGYLVPLVIGYLLVLGPWFARNVAVIGTPLSPAGTKTIWLTEYNDLFCYGCDLSPASYFAWGWGNILRSKLWALWVNFQRLLAEGGIVYLLPFAIAGFYRLRRRTPFLLAGVYLVGVYLAHSLVFTFPGWRGGFFHASAAALPFLYAAGIEGLDAAVRWAARRRRTWRYGQAQAVFVGAAVIGAVGLSGFAAWTRIPRWRTADVVYEDADRFLTERGAVDAAVMVGNPPALWYHTERGAIAVPNGDVETLLTVADRYGIGFVVLEAGHPEDLAELYAGEVEDPRLTLLNAWQDGRTVLYGVER